ncbi:MAG: hypothetical protein Q8M09_08550 [Pseudomonadota bacterium]|nr:hypothetical protein [Pseudomonadota bacterium]MDP1904278.1 hypothetical protein [Pseudomonadota bacterium]MDP2351860.1 hypothetical protein [Pseudomonadota bacterium]
MSRRGRRCPPNANIHWSAYTAVFPPYAGFKLGAGYNFTDFSDDLTDVSYRSHGWFINLIGKM